MPSYFHFPETYCDIRLWMRKKVADWMHDVIVEENTKEVTVFALSINLLDRFISKFPTEIKRQNLQLLGAACLLISSKLNESECLCKSNLVIYSDKSFDADQLRIMELRVLEALNWDIYSITAVDFLDHLCSQVDSRYGIGSETNQACQQSSFLFCQTCLFVDDHPFLERKHKIFKQT